MPTPPNHIMADKLAAFVPVCGSIPRISALRMLFREFGVQGIRAEAVLQIARLRGQVVISHGGATLTKQIEGRNNSY